MNEDTFSISDSTSDECWGIEGQGNNPNAGACSNVYEVSRSSCYTCNGYYGYCYDDPICSTCHAFLFPNTAPAMERPLTLENSSDSDSGNDEPVDSSQDNLPTGYDILYGQHVPVRADNLANELQRLSTASVGSEWTIDFKVEMLPPEVLMHMFQYLDELSLWSISQVCTRWREVLFMCVKRERWRDFMRLRWPLFPMDHATRNWYEMYTAMMLSSCCFKCVKQMAAQQLPPNWEENSWRRHRLRSEIKTMRNDPLDGIDAMPLDCNCCHWQATIEGPAGSPYEGGLFFLYIQVPTTYPLDPPVVRFITKIFHPNVSRHGDVGIDSIHHNWSLALTISKVLISIQSLLTDPFVHVCMEPEIGEIYKKDKKAFEEQAKSWTSRHAMHDLLSF